MPLLRNCLRNDSVFVPLVQAGIGALAGAHRGLIALGQRVRIGDSLDLDTALAVDHPNDNRWDYIFSVPDVALLVGLEPHTAGDHEISTVIKKKEQALQQLRNHLQPRYAVTRWFWATTGRCMFSNMERARRRLDAAGIEYVGREIRRFE